jgi:transposase InsO family protein
VYVAFIVDVFSRMIAGWQASQSLRADLAIDALEMAVHNRSRQGSLDGLVHHSDRGVQRPMPQHPLLGTARHQRHRRLGRHQRRQLRLRGSWSGDEALDGRIAAVVVPGGLTLVMTDFVSLR